MEYMYSNLEIPNRYFGDSSKRTNWILDSGVACHTTQEISYFIPGSLEETDKYNEVSDGHFVTEKNEQEKFK